MFSTICLLNFFACWSNCVYLVHQIVWVTHQQAILKGSFLYLLFDITFSQVPLSFPNEWKLEKCTLIIYLNNRNDIQLILFLPCHKVERDPDDLQTMFIANTMKVGSIWICRLNPKICKKIQWILGCLSHWRKQKIPHHNLEASPRKMICIKLKILNYKWNFHFGRWT